MIESYTRALWLEFVVDDERAKQLMTRDKSDYNILSGEKGFPPLNQIWESLQKAAALAVMQNTIDWLQEKRTWWNDSAHIGPNALYMACLSGCHPHPLYVVCPLGLQARAGAGALRRQSG